MTNLIPVQLDKDTGRLFAKSVSGGGASSVTGYAHTQGVAASTWTIAHNMSSQNIIVQIYDTVGVRIIEDSTTIIDENNITVGFGASQAGTAILVAFA